jgi:RNA polymerase sigma-70 factor (sigma-E family)
MSAGPAGFHQFVVARSPALLRTAWMLTGDDQAAQDLLQEALVKTWPKWTRGASDRPDAYVRTVMVRLQNSWSRRLWRGEAPTARLPERPARDELAGADVRLSLRTALAAMPRAQRQVVVLRYYEDLSERETAAVLGCSVGTVKSQSSKGLAKLRAHAALQTPVEEPR